MGVQDKLRYPDKVSLHSPHNDLDQVVIKKPARGPGMDNRAQRRTRAIANIAKHAGEYAHEASKTRWIQDMVMAMDQDYLTQIKDLKERNADLTAHHSETCDGYDARLASAHARIGDLEARLAGHEGTIHAANVQNAHNEAEIERIRAALEAAEAAAVAASEECAYLQRSLMHVTEEDSKNRKQLALRSYLLRETLLKAKSELRAHRAVVKQQHVALGRQKTDQDAILSRETEKFGELRDLAAQYKNKQIVLEHEVKRLNTKCKEFRKAAGFRPEKRTSKGTAQRAAFMMDDSTQRKQAWEEVAADLEARREAREIRATNQVQSFAHGVQWPKRDHRGTEEPSPCMDDYLAMYYSPMHAANTIFEQHLPDQDDAGRTRHVPGW